MVVQTGIDLVSGNSSEPRLDAFQQIQHPSDFSRMLAIRIVGYGKQSMSDDIHRRTQEADVVKLGKEPVHILHTSAQEQYLGVLGGQEVLMELKYHPHG